MAKATKGAGPIRRVPTGYVLEAEAVRRLRLHAMTTGESAAEILEGLIRAGLPDYKVTAR